MISKAMILSLVGGLMSVNGAVAGSAPTLLVVNESVRASVSIEYNSPAYQPSISVRTNSPIRHQQRQYQQQQPYPQYHQENFTVSCRTDASENEIRQEYQKHHVILLPQEWVSFEDQLFVCLKTFPQSRPVPHPQLK